MQADLSGWIDASENLRKARRDAHGLLDYASKHAGGDLGPLRKLEPLLKQLRVVAKYHEYDNGRQCPGDRNST
jgi:hypothetical protein